MSNFDLSTIPDRYAVTNSGLIVPESSIILMASLSVTKPDGTSVYEEVVPARSLVRNFGKFLEMLFSLTDVTLTSTSNVGTIPRFKVNSLTTATPTKIAFGISAATPTSPDIALGSQHTTGTAVVGGVYGSSSCNVQVAATVAAVSAVTITEIGLIVNWTGTDTSNRDIMLARDTFAGVAVAAGDLITGKYTFTMNV